MDSAASAPGLPMLGRDPPIPPIPPNHIGECGAPGCPGMRYPDCVNLSNGGVGPPPWYGATCWSWLCSEVNCGNGLGCWCEVVIEDALAQSRPALAPPEPEYPLPFVPRSGWVSADPPAALRSLRSYIRGADSPPSADLGAREGSAAAATADAELSATAPPTRFAHNVQPDTDGVCSQCGYFGEPVGCTFGRATCAAVYCPSCRTGRECVCEEDSDGSEIGGSVSAAEMTDLVRALHITGRISDAADASDEAEAAAIACAISASSAAPPLASAAISEACIAAAARFESAVLDYAIIASSEA